MEQTQEKNQVNIVNIVFLITIAISIIAGFLPLKFLEGNIALQLLFSQGILVIPALVYMIKYKKSYRETVRFHKMKVGDIFLCILFGILIQPLLTFLNALSLVFTTNSVNTVMFEISEQIPFFAGVILIAFVPCVLEETVYRGVFYNEYRKVDPWKAVLLSGALFGLMHGNLNQFVYATVMGILFALLIEATGSILSTMLIHFCVNAWSVVTIYTLPKMYDMLKEIYGIYKEHGYEDLAKELEFLIGDFSLTASEWIRQMMQTSETVELTIGSVVYVYGMQAVAMSFLAYLVYKKLAKRNGNWERICEFFGNKKEDAEPIVTVPLMIGIAIGVVFMFFYELQLLMPR